MNISVEEMVSPTSGDLHVEQSPRGRATAEDWRRSLARVVPAVVVLNTAVPRAFDTETAGSSTATGFVVDKSRGIILTNRHVVNPGPVVAAAVFVSKEETPVYPIYRDPVHDFGFFHYDPQAIKFLNFGEIPLSPETACVGLEVRVVGNDSGEEVSILAGTLARLDREAPQYCKDGYNDFNTFYIQAASGTKGGSSGSPVIDCFGRAVALNAGGKTTSASAFFLPLDRVSRALNLIKEHWDGFDKKSESSTIPRGTLQVTFLHKGFDEIRRLGLKDETEQRVRSSSARETGMLVVDSVVPDGPAHKILEPGDVLVLINGQVITHFLKLESLLDDNVGNKIDLQIERGGIPLEFQLVVQDLHSITPNCFLEVSGGIINPLSYQQARNFRFNCGLPYVAETGYMLSRARVPRFAIIKKFAGKDVSTLDDLVTALSKVTRGAKIPLEYITYTDRHRNKTVLVTIDEHPYYPPILQYVRNGAEWKTNLVIELPTSEKVYSDGCSTLKEQSHVEVPSVDEAKLLDHKCASSAENGESGNKDLHNSGAETGCCDDKTSINMSKIVDSPANGGMFQDRSPPDVEEARVVAKLDGDDRVQNEKATPSNGSSVEQLIEPCLVMFDVNVPPVCMIDGVHSRRFMGTGLIVYHSDNLGLVAVDRNTVAISLSDITLSFAAYPIEISAEVVFLHPVHNYALIAYNPAALGASSSSIRAAELLPEPPLHRGDTVYLVGLSDSLQTTSRKSIVTNTNVAMCIQSADCPRFRATNVEVIELDTDFGSSFSGILTDEYGRVHALWASFSFQVNSDTDNSEDRECTRGLPIYTISQVLDKIINGSSGPPRLINGIKRPMPLVRILEVELSPTLLSKARSFGLSDSWVEALAQKDPLRRQVLCVEGCFTGSKAENLLKQGDMILAINKVPVTCFRDIEIACDMLDKNGSLDEGLSMTILRQEKEIDLVVGTDIRDGNGTTRIVCWCGCLVQEPHPAVRALGFLPEEGHGVYVARWSYGSPSSTYNLYALKWIVEVNGQPTPDLDHFIEVVKGLEHGEFVRVKTVNLDGTPRVRTMKQNLCYWPTWELRFEPEKAVWRRTAIKAFDPAIA